MIVLFLRFFAIAIIPYRSPPSENFEHFLGADLYKIQIWTAPAVDFLKIQTFFSKIENRCRNSTFLKTVFRKWNPCPEDVFKMLLYFENNFNFLKDFSIFLPSSFMHNLLRVLKLKQQQKFFSANSKTFSIGCMKVLIVVYIYKSLSEKIFLLWKSRFETSNIEKSILTCPPPRIITMVLWKINLRPSKNPIWDICWFCSIKILP